MLLDEHEEFELFQPLSYTKLTNCPISPVYSVSVFIETCRLSTILERIFLSLYNEKSKSRDPDDLLRESRSLHAELLEWRRALPPHLDIKPSDPVSKKALPHTLSLLLVPIAFFTKEMTNSC